MAKVIWRDDDISVHTDFTLFKSVHEIFKKHQVNHRLAILAKDLWENKELFWYICSEPFIDAQLHGWTHIDYEEKSRLRPNQVYANLKKCLTYLAENSERMTKGAKVIKPTVFLPPWNKTSHQLEGVCKEVGLEIDIRRGKNEGVILFHYWSDYNNIEKMIMENK